LWIRVNAQNSDNDFWYVDYENGIATHSDQRPKHESVRKWRGTILEFLQKRQMRITEKTESIIKFKQESD